MPVLRYLSTSIRSLVVVVADTLDEGDRSDIADLILNTDEITIIWEGGRIDFSEYTALGGIGGVDLLLYGLEAEELAALLSTSHKENGVIQQVPGIKLFPEEVVATETAWRLTSRVKYWEPRRPVRSYPGYEEEPFLRVNYTLDEYNLLKVHFTVETNMSFQVINFDFGDDTPHVQATELTGTSHLYGFAGTFYAKIVLDEGNGVFVVVQPAFDPMMPQPATVLEITATAPS